MGVSQSLIILMGNLYCGQDITIKTKCQETQWFPTNRSVREGCALFSYLLDLYADHTKRWTCFR